MDRSWTDWSRKKCPMGSKKSYVFAGLLSIFGVPLHATDIYRWVDDSGKTQMADRVPEQYKAVAKRINSSRFELSDAQRQEAETRAAKDKSHVVSNQTDVIPTPVAADIPKSAEPAPKSECSQKWDEYYSSQECFAPYKRPSRYGAITMAEAYEKCKVVEAPVKTCEVDKRPWPK